MNTREPKFCGAMTTSKSANLTTREGGYISKAQIPPDLIGSHYYPNRMSSRPNVPDYRSKWWLIPNNAATITRRSCGHVVSATHMSMRLYCCGRCIILRVSSYFFTRQMIFIFGLARCERPHISATVILDHYAVQQSRRQYH